MANEEGHDTSGMWIAFLWPLVPIALIAGLASAVGIVHLSIRAKSQWTVSPFLTAFMGMLWVESFFAPTTGETMGWDDYYSTGLSMPVSFYTLFLLGLGMVLLPSEDRHTSITLPYDQNHPESVNAGPAAPQHSFDGYTKSYTILLCIFTSLVALASNSRASDDFWQLVSQLLLCGCIALWLVTFLLALRSVRRSARMHTDSHRQYTYIPENATPAGDHPLLPVRQARLLPHLTARTPYLLTISGILLCAMIIAVALPFDFRESLFVLGIVIPFEGSLVLAFVLGYGPQFLITVLAAIKDEPGILAAQAVGSSVGLIVSCYSGLWGQRPRPKDTAVPFLAVMVMSPLIAAFAVRVERRWRRVVGFVMMALWLIFPVMIFVL